VLSVRAVVLRTGIVGGALFFLHALVPGSRSYPFVWPTLTGAVAFWMATDAVAPHRFRRGMSAALGAGILVGLIGFIGATFTVLALGHAVLNSTSSALGPGGPLLIATAAELGIATVGVLAVAAAVVGGAAMMPVRWLRPSSPDARAA
jgi:hypothetical protein